MKSALFVLWAAVLAGQDLETLQSSARAAYAKGDYASARQSLEQAWELLQSTPQIEPKRYEVMKQLSSTLSALGDYAGATNYVDMAINWRENVNGHDDPKLADEWIELATLCQRQKDFLRATALLQIAMGEHVRMGAKLAVADDWSRMALVDVDEKYQYRSPKRAAGELGRAIEIRENVLGAEHPAILSELDRLAAIWLTMRDYEQAEAAFRRALVIRERLAGRTSADLISTVEGLAYAQFGLKKFDEAEAGYQRLLSLWAASTGDPAHPMVALTLDKMAVFYRETKRWDEGTAAAEKAIAVRALFLASGLTIEATALQGHGDNKEAGRLYRRALAALDESRPEHVSARKTLEKNLSDLDAAKKH